MKILILGATGTLGTAVEEACINREIGFTSLSQDNFEITNFKESEITRYGCDVVMNGVVMQAVDICEKESVKSFDINSVGVGKLAKICQENGMVFIQPSTHAVFDGKKTRCYTEEDKPNPINVYGVSKYAAEFLAKNLCEKHYIHRLPTLFGNRRNKELGFTDKVYNWLKEGKDLRISTDVFDCLSYTKDVANRFIDIIEEGKPYGIYHIANNGSSSYYEFVCKMRDLLGLNNKIDEAMDSDFPSLALKPLNMKMSSVKLPPMRKWDDALEEFLREDKRDR